MTLDSLLKDACPQVGGPDPDTKLRHRQALLAYDEAESGQLDHSQAVDYPRRGLTGTTARSTKPKQHRRGLVAAAVAFVVLGASGAVLWSNGLRTFPRTSVVVDDGSSEFANDPPGASLAPNAMQASDGGDDSEDPPAQEEPKSHSAPTDLRDALPETVLPDYPDNWQFVWGQAQPQIGDDPGPNGKVVTFSYSAEPARDVLFNVCLADSAGAMQALCDPALNYAKDPDVLRPTLDTTAPPGIALMRFACAGEPCTEDNLELFNEEWRTFLAAD